ncbi:hypothetical protein BH11ARM2_BH11ARM2_28080 [soil metagenome]
MKLKLALGLSLLAALAVAGSETPMEVAKRFSTAYVKAMKTKDLTHFDQGSTEDFVYIDGHGRKAGKTQAVAGIKSAFSMMTITSFDVKVVSAKKAEGGVLYVTEAKMVATMKTGGPKPSMMVSNMRDETLVVPKGNKWYYKRVKELKDDTTIDGKPMKM